MKRPALPALLDLLRQRGWKIQQTHLLTVVAVHPRSHMRHPIDPRYHDLYGMTDYAEVTAIDLNLDVNGRLRSAYLRVQEVGLTTGTNGRRLRLAELEKEILAIPPGLKLDTSQSCR